MGGGGGGGGGAGVRSLLQRCVDSACFRRLRCLARALNPKAAPIRLPHPQPLDALNFARFTGIPTFMRLPHLAQPEEARSPP